MLDTFLVTINNKLRISDSVQSLNGVGPKLSERLNYIGIYKIIDLIFYSPKSYKDYRDVRDISNLSDGDEVTIKGKIISSGLLKSRRKIYEVVINDGTGHFKIIWFNPIYGYLKQNFKPDSWIVISGKVSATKNRKIFQFINPKPENYNIFEDDIDVDQYASISSIYPLTKGLTLKRLKQLIKEALERVDLTELDILSKDLIKEFKLKQVSSSLIDIHLPDRGNNFIDLSSTESVQNSLSYKSLVFMEFLMLCLGIKLNRPEKNLKLGIKQQKKDKSSLFDSIFINFPFDLTDSQKNVLNEILNDMGSNKQMNRLLQGDVGSGKTIIALLAMAVSYDNGYQTALIAPTEILSDQHFLFLKKYVPNDEIVILKSSLKQNEKKETYEKIKNGNAKFIVGTHSLFQENVDYHSLGLIVIDEQHRFGVEQRKNMIDKGLKSDLLIMTATPIPRTLSSIFFSDFDISKISELPKKRGNIETKIVSKSNLDKLYNFISDQLVRGRQAFVLCPMIDKSDVEEFEKLIDIKSQYDYISRSSLGKFKSSTLHGKMSSLEKEQIMEQFRNKEIDILISTTVIEVGVDIPNANLMIINNPERFGLAQLHQLRGRIGRGIYDSYCIMLVDDLSENSLDRIRTFAEIKDGFLLAEKDLQMRGPGAFYGVGTEQSGNIWELNFADLKRDIEILKSAKNCSDKYDYYEFYKSEENVNKINKLIKHLWGYRLELTKAI